MANVMSVIYYSEYTMEDLDGRFANAIDSDDEDNVPSSSSSSSSTPRHQYEEHNAAPPPSQSNSGTASSHSTTNGDKAATSQEAPASLAPIKFNVHGAGKAEHRPSTSPR